MDFYTTRDRCFEEKEPWDVVDYGISKTFLKREYDKAMMAITTENCKDKCNGCGINKFCGRECFGNN